ncbi:MAG: carboxypeptidase regulatory-like domain-containing protein [Planctomycetes bacterium]|nr:carboxypeptidase regulatory-like domain-containing protein [Planctomycetota bacterium]
MLYALMNLPTRHWLRVILLLLLVGGCGGDSDGLAPVDGTIIYRGKPLPNARVVFMPETPGALPASGTTDDAGRYELMTSVPGDGARVGKHRVTVTARGPDKLLPANQLTTGLPGSNTAPGDPLIPPRYFMPNTSGLTAEVTAGGATVDFELTER